MVPTEPAVAVKLAVAVPFGTVTEAGTLSAALFEDSATVAPLAGAGAEIVTMHVEFAPEATVAEHVRFDTVVAVIVSCVAADVPFNEAVSDAD